jgi:hypothetical protein
MRYPIDPRIAIWQADRHEVGMIAFCPSDAAADCFPYYSLPREAMFLGLMESDALCATGDGAIVVFDHERPGRVLCKAATNQAAFLAALAVLEDHFNKCDGDTSYWEDGSAAIEIRERCAAIAGGEEYESFYCSMVGA